MRTSPVVYATYVLSLIALEALLRVSAHLRNLACSEYQQQPRPWTKKPNPPQTKNDNRNFRSAHSRLKYAKWTKPWRNPSYFNVWNSRHIHARRIAILRKRLLKQSPCSDSGMLALLRKLWLVSLVTYQAQTPFLQGKSCRRRCICMSTSSSSNGHS